MMTRPLRLIFLPAALVLAVLGLSGCNSLSIMGPGSFSTVVIDAGHGGKDTGGRSRSGILEKDVALDTARRLRSLLLNAGFRTVMIRSDDTFVELDDRVNTADRYSNAILVSIHYNASPSSGPSGIETFYWRTDSHGLAANVEKHLVEETALDRRGVTRRVLRLTHNPQIPSILCECGFLTNAHESSLISGGDFRQRIAEGIAKGIVDQHDHGDAGVSAFTR